MKKITHTLLLLLTSSLLYGQAFITTWKTDNPGTSNDNQITIPTEGTGYNYSVDWGDGNNDTGVSGDMTHTYASPGTYTVSISGDLPRIYFNNEGDREKILSIEQWGDIEWESFSSAFWGCSNVNSLATDAPDLSVVTNISDMFGAAPLFNGVIGHWDVSNVETMRGVFAGASSFNQNISNWDVSNVTTMNSLFFGASSFNQDIGTWNVSQLGVMRSMFYDAIAFNQDLSDWNVSNVFNMQNTFRNATVFNQSIENWNVSNVTNMVAMFLGAEVFNGNVSNWDVSSVTDMGNMFDGATNFNQDLNNWNVSSVLDMLGMFEDAVSFNGNVTNWDVSSVANMQGMFDNVSAFNQNLENWDVSSVTDMDDIFDNGGLSINNYDAILNAWSQLTLQSDVRFGVGSTNYCNAADSRQFIIDNFNWDITDRGEDCTSFITRWKTDNQGSSNDNQISIPTEGTGYNYSVNWGDGNSDVGVTGDVTHTYASSGTYTVLISGDFPRINFNNTGDKRKLLRIDQWGDISWSSMENAFFGCRNLNIEASDAPDLTSVTSMKRMFLFASELNADINHWDVNNVTDMNGLFAGATIFNSELNNWDVSNVTDMATLFDAAAAFNQVIGDWNVTNLVTDMEGMFRNATNFNQNINSWDVSSVTNMGTMFDGANNFNQPLNNWDVGSLTEIYDMFKGASLFNQELNNWDVSKVEYMNSMFESALAFNHSLNNWDVSNVINMSGMFRNTSTFNGDISSWNVENVDNMISMFRDAISFDGDIGNWNTSNVTDMTNVFFGATSFNQDIGNWDVGNVTVMQLMFQSAESFDQDLSSWDVSSVTNMDQMFNNSGLLRINYDAILEGWSQLSLQSNVSFGADGTNYCNSADVHQAIIDNFNWTITDDGEDCTLFDETDIITFNFPDFEDSDTIDPVNHTIDVLVGFMADPSSLIADFTLSAGATSDPVSGTAQDFSSPFIYTVTAEDGTTTQEWTVTVEVQNVDPEDIALDNSSLDENNAIDAVIGSFTTTDGNLSDTHSYMLVEGEGDTYNQSFDILGNELIANEVFDFETKSSYSIRVRTTDAGGSSFEKQFSIAINDLSGVVQSITFGALAEVNVDGAAFDLTASASSGLEVSYTSSDVSVATISGSTVTIVGAGATTITASQEGDGDYAAATDVAQVLTVNKLDQSITFSIIQDQIFENGSFTLSATASSGLAVSYEVVNGFATITGNVVTFTDLGTVAISASQVGDDAFSAATSVEQSFDVVTVTGFEGKEVQTNVQIFPNPVRDVLHINLGSEQLLGVFMTDLKGKQLEVNRNGASVNTTSLKGGYYLLTVVTDQGTSVQRIIKQ